MWKFISSFLIFNLFYFIAINLISFIAASWYHNTFAINFSDFFVPSTALKEITPSTLYPILLGIIFLFASYGFGALNPPESVIMFFSVAMSMIFFLITINALYLTVESSILAEVVKVFHDPQRFPLFRDIWAGLFLGSIANFIYGEDISI